MKSKKAKHLIFFDDSCPLCWRSVNRVLAWDKKKIFRFTPLAGPDGKHVLRERWKSLKNANTLILVENYASSDAPKLRKSKQKTARIWIKGRAVMRILWLLGGWKKIPGTLAYVPFGIDSLYSFIAKRRHRTGSSRH